MSSQHAEADTESRSTEREIIPQITQLCAPFPDISLLRGLHFDSLLDDPKYSDLTIHCDGRTFRVHKVIICLQSKPLAAHVDNPFLVSSSILVAAVHYVSFWHNDPTIKY